MAKGEIIIDEMFCRGCGYCEKFCTRGCIETPGDKLSSEGYLLPVFANPDKCNACGICGWMCPHFAIEVYKYVEAKTTQG
jgi:2-oxoglutarate ferredoxin oxidoreductase subunit delta